MNFGMDNVFRVTVFPAEDGDCLLLSYGSKNSLAHALIDGGRASTWPKLKPHLIAIRERGEPFELLVCTHIDADHIEGLLKLAGEDGAGLVPKRVWFNGYPALESIEIQGERQGENLTNQFERLKWPVNAEFQGGRLSMEACPQCINVAGLNITLLSPDDSHLEKLKERWEAWKTQQAMAVAASNEDIGIEILGKTEMPAPLVVEELKLPSPIDTEPPNGSSIAFIAEYAGRSILLAGDAHPDLLCESLQKLAEETGSIVQVDLLKVSHHGSKRNTTRELIENLDCRRFLISTNGRNHHHPDPEAIARLLAFANAGPKTLYFNYETKWTAPWSDPSLESGHAYEAVFPTEDSPLVIDI